MSGESGRIRVASSGWGHGLEGEGASKKRNRGSEMHVG